MQQQKSTRESEQERQWKQLQAIRQAQQQQQQQAMHDQRIQAMARINRQMGDDTNGTLTSQLQVATNQDPQGMSPIVSPSTLNRPQFPVNSSVKVTRIHPGQAPSPFTPPMVPRTMRPPLHSPLQSPLPESFQGEEGFAPRFPQSRPAAPFSGPRPDQAFDQNPEVTRHLRELLQRQKESVANRQWIPNLGLWSRKCIIITVIL